MKTRLSTTKSTTNHTTGPNWLNQSIELVLILAIGLTPLLFTPATSELFEFPKMVFVYGLAICSLTLIAIHAFITKEIILFRTPLNKLLILYLLTFIIATLLSIDLYTSIMGYYTRFNGGLASLAAYLLLFYLTLIYLMPTYANQSSEVSEGGRGKGEGGRNSKGSRLQVSGFNISGLFSKFNPSNLIRQSQALTKLAFNGQRSTVNENPNRSQNFSVFSFWPLVLSKASYAKLDDSEPTPTPIPHIPHPTFHILYPVTHKIHRILWTWLIASFIVSIWGILEHFGYDVGCYLLRGNIEATCWVQDVQARVFSSFGQPNWLAAYLLTSLPLAIYLLTTENRPFIRLIALIITIANYAAFWYTFSRSGWVGLIAVIIILLPLFVQHFKQSWKWLTALVIACSIISLSGLSMASQRTATSLESGEFDSSTGQIRLLVWEGSLNTALQYPLFGSGPETFAYSFLPHRPEGLNQTTEWNFLYNKAHNDVLHNTATLGLTNTTLWLSLYLVVGYIAWKQTRQPHSDHLPLALFAGLAGVFTAQLFGFSVVVTSLFFWLAVAIILARSTLASSYTIRLPASSFWLWLVGAITPLVLLFGLIRYTAAEVIATQATSNSRTPALAINQLDMATTLNPFEPKYHRQLARSYAQLAQWNPQNQSNFIDLSLASASQAYAANPFNMINLKSLISTYQILGQIDPDHLNQAINLTQYALVLDPHDLVLHQQLAESYTDQDQDQLALNHYNYIVESRPHPDSYLLRADHYQQTNQLTKALQDLQQAHNIDPENKKVNRKLTEIEEKLGGIN